MADFHGGAGADTINQATLTNLTSGQVIYGEGGEDSITATTAQVQGGAGNDTISGSATTIVVYWNSPAGISANLATGIVQDGYGGTDRLNGIHFIHGSGFSDTLTGSATNDSFHGHGGSDHIVGGGGVDEVRYLFVKSTDAVLTYDLAQDAVIVQKHFATGETGTDVLKGISYITFSGTGSDNKAVAVSALKPSAFTVVKGPDYGNADAGGNPRWAIADFNGDGEQDIVLRYDPESAFSATVTGASPLRFFAGSSASGLTQDPTFLNPNASPTNVGKIVTTDLNGDGRPDVIVAASGQDPYINGVPVGPTPGETSYVLISNQGHLSNVPVSGAIPVFGHHAVVGDINNDGYQDVFVDSININPSYFIMGGPSGSYSADYSRLTSGISTYHNTVISTFPTGEWKTQVTSVGTATALIDANKDGYLDLAILPEDGTPTGYIYLNDRTGHFSESNRITLPAGPFGAGLLSRDTPNGPTHSNGTIYLDTAVIDVNGDGRDDLISITTDSQQSGSQFVYYRGAKVQILISTPTGFVDESSRVDFAYAPTDNYSHYFTLRMDDFNADGFKDIVLYRNTDFAATAILLNDGTGHFGQAAYPAGLPDGLIVALDAGKGEYAILHSARDPGLAANGFATYTQSVDEAYFDWSKGLDFITGLPDGRGAALKSDIPGRRVHGTNIDNTIQLSTGDEQAWGYGGADTINGDAGNDTIDGGEGTSYLRGDAGDDVIQGGGGFDDANGNMGNDTIHGGAGDDYSVGGKDNDLLFGDAGNDIVWGNLGNDTCDGGDGNDQVRGGQGDDSVAGGAGNDFVSGDRGNDTITGGTGADNFHDSQDAGIDRVLDFKLSEGDRVQLDPGTTYTVSQVGADTVLDMGGGNQMILVGVTFSSLTPGWVFLG